MARLRAHDYDEKRRLILKNAAALFARHGYGGASITMIAEACGVSKALVYHYYSDKEALLFDIISDHLLQLVDVVEAVVEDAEPRQRLCALAGALLYAYRNADAEHQVQINNLKLLPVQRLEQLKDLERELVAHFSRAIAKAVPGMPEDLLKPVTMSLFGMLNWHYLWFREGRGLSRADYARLVTELILSGTPAAAAALAAPGESESARPKTVGKL
jgi:AcrR family transcriptional regulator